MGVTPAGGYWYYSSGEPDGTGGFRFRDDGPLCYSSLHSHQHPRREGLLKHIQPMTKTPGKADDFTTGEKLALAAGIADAVAAFFEDKEGVDTTS
jgi:hypothetical protein